MKFGPLPLDGAEGTILAHSIRLPDGSTLRKGAILEGNDVVRLREAGIERPVVARLEPGDVREAEAAETAAARLAGHGLHATPARAGRATIVADLPGLLEIDAETIHRINREVPELQIATLPMEERVDAGRIVATVKVLPFAVPAAAMRRVDARLAPGPSLRIRPFEARRVRLLVTRPDGVGDRALDLAQDRILRRIRELGSEPLPCERIPHRIDDLAERIGPASEDVDLLLIYGGASTADLDDVIPRALRRAGGRVDRFGMPVDPGNLLLLGALGTTPVVGVPACARSPAESGFDRVLERFAAGHELGSDQLAALGVGGLLKSRAARDRHSVEGNVPDGVAGVVLAAGRSQRMGPRDKLLLPVDGEPMVRRAARAALEAGLDPVMVVVRPEGATAVRDALHGLPVRFTHAVDADEGMSRSLSAGLHDLPSQVRAAVILLGDMPGVRAEHVRRLASAWAPEEGRVICIPVHGRRRGNPVLWDRRFFEEIHRLEGDRGARTLLDAYGSLSVEVEMPDDGILHDVDSPEDLSPEA